MVERKASEPIDPAGLSIPYRRHGEIGSSCFDLDMNTIETLREKADKALGRVSLERAANNGGEITCVKDIDDESSHSSEDCSDEVDEEELQTKDCGQFSELFLPETKSKHFLQRNSSLQRSL